MPADIEDVPVRLGPARAGKPGKPRPRSLPNPSILYTALAAAAQTATPEQTVSLTGCHRHPVPISTRRLAPAESCPFAAGVFIMQKNKRHFTLLEILIVLGIIIVIVGLTTPAFSRLVIGSAVDQAGQMVSGQLAIARGEAIARRQCVALVMPGKSYGAGDEGVNKCYQAFRLALVEQDGTDYKFDEWLPGSEWAYLPNGAIIAQVTSDEPWDTNGELTQSGTSPDYEYTPTGTCSASDSTKQLKANGSLSHDVRAVIFTPEGQADQWTYITLMEGIAPANEDEPRNTNPNNLFVLAVSPMTGKAATLFPAQN